MTRRVGLTRDSRSALLIMWYPLDNSKANSRQERSYVSTSEGKCVYRTPREKIKSYLKSFFNSLEKIARDFSSTACTIDGAPPKTVARLTARSTGHAQKCTREEKSCSG